MANFDMAAHIRFEESLKVGDTVELRWTNSFRYYRAKAKVTKLNTHSLRGELLDNLVSEKGVLYGKGREIIVPRLTMSTLTSKWSHNNGVFPVKEGVEMYYTTYYLTQTVDGAVGVLRRANTDDGMQSEAEELLHRAKGTVSVTKHDYGIDSDGEPFDLYTDLFSGAGTGNDYLTTVYWRDGETV